MKDNYELCIVGQTCVLVPYRRAHVERYHGWMQRPELLQATGSEPLSLQEEYDMQQSWRTDDQKCTFIVLQRSLLLHRPPPPLSEGEKDETEPCRDDEFIADNVSAMVGDVNLFLSPIDDDDDIDNDEQNNSKNSGSQPANTSKTSNNHPPLVLQAELDIMIAEDSARGQGIGQEAVCLMMLYGAQHLGIQRFFCKINADNTASIALFGNKLGFQQCDFAECFQQYEYHLYKQESPQDIVRYLEPFVTTTHLCIIHCCCSDEEEGYQRPVPHH